MTTSIFPQTVVAMIWDFDKTLIPGYMQEPLFAHFKVDEREFWAEVGKLAEIYRQNDVTSVRDIASRIVRDKERAVGQETGAVPRHFVE